MFHSSPLSLDRKISRSWSNTPVQHGLSTTLCIVSEKILGDTFELTPKDDEHLKSLIWTDLIHSIMYMCVCVCMRTYTRKWHKRPREVVKEETDLYICDDTYTYIHCMHTIKSVPYNLLTGDSNSKAFPPFFQPTFPECQKPTSIHQ